MTAIDGSGKSGEPLTVNLVFNGIETKSVPAGHLAMDETPSQILGLEEAFRAASLKGVETLGNAIGLVGNFGGALDILSLLKGYADAFDQV